MRNAGIITPHFNYSAHIHSAIIRQRRRERCEDHLLHQRRPGRRVLLRLRRPGPRRRLLGEAHLQWPRRYETRLSDLHIRASTLGSSPPSRRWSWSSSLKPPDGDDDQDELGAEDGVERIQGIGSTGTALLDPEATALGTPDIIL